MPPRIPAPLGLQSLTLCLRPAAAVASPSPTLLPLTQKANLSRKEKVRRMKQDPRGWAAAQARKAVNVKRQEELQSLKAHEWGSPVHGIPTPFVESFDSAGQAPLSTPPVDEFGITIDKPHPLPTSPHIKNFLLTKEEVEAAIEQSRKLTTPLASEEPSVADPETEAAEAREHAARHAKAMTALQRIADLNHGSAKDRKHANIRRCIETFGRHATDQTLKRPAPPPVPGVEPVPKPVRAGPDTGSSEVQIAILTAKIRALAQKLEEPKGKRDKNNKRSLRSLCHRRQRLLRYMERKERGSERWQHMIATLGLTPATWKEQITL
ncbi:hypothetical protein B0H66DRAFT_605614 [Apodospora peruviana]|uniref:Ribosomal protein S15 n=1 Tax=Apodospora peruviana TaxID=516989 RepID=A0AAE0M0K7_9PEZI|nr:hypothetical protein B0H66DRAFT_605614 [Apodospora peruviana]